MDFARWQRFLPLFAAFSIRPILAIVPDNRDAELIRGPANPAFWEQMRTLQHTGATIGLHGYQHQCRSSGKSLVNLHKHSEFAGAAEASQRQWIHSGLAILRYQGLSPTVWVAPRHGSDKTTLNILREADLTVISDGFGQAPYRRFDCTWIPQQLWAPLVKRSGLWTIAYHSNTTSDSAVQDLSDFLKCFSPHFTSVSQVLRDQVPKQFALLDRMEHLKAVSRIRTSRFRKSLQF